MNLCNALVRLVNETLKHLAIIIHPLIDHDLDTALSDLDRLNECRILRNTDRRLCLHLSCPVGECECLVRGQRSKVNLDDTSLEDVLTELIKHLSLCCVNNVTEVHVVLHFTLEGHLHGFRNRHGGFTRSKRESHGAGIRTKRNPLGHTCVGVSTDGDIPVVDGEVVEHLVDHVCHRVVFTLRVTCCDQTKLLHEAHQAWNVRLCLLVPNRSRVTTRLVGTVNDWRNDGGSHRFQLLRRHQTCGVLRTNDVDLDTYVRTCMESLLASHTHSIAVEDLFNGSEPLPLMGNFFG